MRPALALHVLLMVLSCDSPDSTIPARGEAKCDSIVRLGTHPNYERTYCTASVIAPGWVLSARHCDLPMIRYLMGPKSIERIRKVVRHPTADLALFASELDQGSKLGPEVILSGRAVKAGEAAFLVRFEESQCHLVSERIVVSSSREIVVDGKGLTGACGGDSGGPLFVKGSAVAVLSKGSADCVGRDYYTALRPYRNWITAVVGGT